MTLASLTAADAPVLLLFTDPRCGPCNALMPRIAGWQREHAGRLTIAVLTRGSISENLAKVREHGIVSVWIDAGLAVYNADQLQGTPGAVLIDSDGRIASAAVTGGEAIADLIRVATRPAAAPAIDVEAGGDAQTGWDAQAGGDARAGEVRAGELQPGRAPPPVGAPAPALDLRDSSGERRPLAAPDRDTLVLFWNPRCGFCRQSSTTSARSSGRRRPALPGCS